MSPTPCIYPHHGAHAATRHHAPLSSRQHHVSLSAAVALIPLPLIHLLSLGRRPSSRGRNSQHLSYLLPSPPLIRSLGNSSNIRTTLSPASCNPRSSLGWKSEREAPERLSRLSGDRLNFPESYSVTSRANSIRGRCEMMSRTKALGVRKDFSGVAQSSFELVEVSKRQLSY